MMVSRFEILRNEKGAVFITALFVLLLLTIIGIAAITTTTTDLQIAGNQKLHSMAFYAAEAGIEVGRELLDDLKKADSNNWSKLLDGTSFTWEGEEITTDCVDDCAPDDSSSDRYLDEVLAANGTSPDVGQARFRLWVRDNDDLDSPYDVDTDDTIVLTSIGEYQIGFLNKVTVKIETQVRYTGGGGQYAQEHYGNDSSGVAAGESDTVADQQRW